MSEQGSYWYHVTEYECQLCGRVKRYRERRTGPKPVNRDDRYEWHADGCSSHFA